MKLSVLFFIFIHHIQNYHNANYNVNMIYGKVSKTPWGGELKKKWLIFSLFRCIFVNVSLTPLNKLLRPPLKDHKDPLKMLKLVCTPPKKGENGLYPP